MQDFCVEGVGSPPDGFVTVQCSDFCLVRCVLPTSKLIKAFVFLVVRCKLSSCFDILQGWTGKLFFSRGGERQGKNLRDGAGRGTPPSPQCGAGRGRGQNLRGGEGPGRGTCCVCQLIEIICCSKGNLNLHCIM